MKDEDYLLLFLIFVACDLRACDACDFCLMIDDV